MRGLGGVTPEIPTHFTALEAAAQKKMAPQAWAYTAGGAGLEASMDANRAAFSRFPSAPRMLVEARQCDLACEIFGVTHCGADHVVTDQRAGDDARGSGPCRCAGDGAPQPPCPTWRTD
ncbi:MAG TPA: alpha-hydroxy-acid oxidizing protein [Vitreimonas sp.]|uniref:alpha-hydroxy-acid oxidizing protein n=1 Tax=Vitreimonas sp. TaxID=3069702 RepID=UPI002D28ACE5|nr:alpha-hydroxy-acid oxidizing protein [Vitreimonas sp.]HYD86542.1 alpha-hydroxy-acid oxidizing protein [Vitreimonas sp.]